MCFSEVSGDEGNLSAGRSPAESMIFGQKVNSWNSIQGSTSGDSEKKRLLDCQEWPNVMLVELQKHSQKKNDMEKGNSGLQKNDV